MKLVSAFVLAIVFAAAAQAQPVKLTFQSNWRAQAEHGGYYQAVATGIYAQARPRRHRPAGRAADQQPAAPGRRRDRLQHGLEQLQRAQLRARTTSRWWCVASIFQKDPRVLIAHPGPGQRLARGDEGQADPDRLRLAQQLLAVPAREATATPTTRSAPTPSTWRRSSPTSRRSSRASSPASRYKTQKAGVKPVVHLLADGGYVSYATTLETRQQLVNERARRRAALRERHHRGLVQLPLRRPRPRRTRSSRRTTRRWTTTSSPTATPRCWKYGIVDSGDALQARHRRDDRRALEGLRRRPWSRRALYPADLDVPRRLHAAVRQQGARDAPQEEVTSLVALRGGRQGLLQRGPRR